MGDKGTSRWTSATARGVGRGMLGGYNHASKVPEAGGNALGRAAKSPGHRWGRGGREYVRRDQRRAHQAGPTERTGKTEVRKTGLGQSECMNSSQNEPRAQGERCTGTDAAAKSTSQTPGRGGLG